MAERSKNGRFEKGHTALKKNGSVSKFTQLKAAFLEAFEQTGGVDGLVSWIKASPRNRGQFYTLITKLFPTEVEHSGELNTNVRFIYGNGHGNGHAEPAP